MAVSILHMNDKQCRIVIDGEMTIDTVMELIAKRTIIAFGDMQK